jgi:hypothetical protein
MRSLQQRCQVPKGDYDKISLNLQWKPHTLKQIEMHIQHFKPLVAGYQFRW